MTEGYKFNSSFKLMSISIFLACTSTWEMVAHVGNTCILQQPYCWHRKTAHAAVCGHTSWVLRCGWRGALPLQLWKTQTTVGSAPPHSDTHATASLRIRDFPFLLPSPTKCTRALLPNYQGLMNWSWVLGWQWPDPCCLCELEPFISPAS